MIGKAAGLSLEAHLRTHRQDGLCVICYRHCSTCLLIQAADLSLDECAQDWTTSFPQ